MDSTPLQIALALLAASVLGAFLPLYRRWSERGLHLFVALSAGVFLGTIFLHLLPHLAGGAGDDGHLHAVGAAPHAGDPLAPWIAALVGLLLLFAVEKVWLPAVTKGGAANQHMVLWSATYLGLSVHALTAGFAFSAVLDHPEGRTQFLLTLLVHKATETFSLATVMRLAGLATGRAIALLALFACIEPIGLLFGRGLVEQLPALDPILTGFASGTFLYVAICDLLPEVFHGQERPRLKLTMVVLGIAATALTMDRLEALAGFSAASARAAVDVFVQMAPFLLFGFLAAGLVHVVLKREWLARHLAGDDLKSVSWAALLGAPLPLCSCSVVPVAVSLRRAGASKGATSAFTISTPETGVDSLAVTWALLGPFLTVARPIGALASAIASGVAVNWMVRRGWDRDAAPGAAAGAFAGTSTAAEQAPAAAPADTASTPDVPSCCHHEESALPTRPARSQPSAGPSVFAARAHGEARALVPVPTHGHAHAHAHEHAHEHDHEHEHGYAHEHAQSGRHGHTHGTSNVHMPVPASVLDRDGSTPIQRVASSADGPAECCAHDAEPAAAAETLAPAWRRIVRHAYVDMLDDLTPSLILGLLLSGVIAVAMPSEWTTSPVLQGFGGLLLMLVVGIPIYVCASASTPIAAALIAKGLSPGAALVFLLAGPATNAASLVVLARHLGRRVVVVQLIALSAVAVLCGWIVNQIQPIAAVAATGAGHEHAHGPTWASIAAAVLLGGLMLASLVRTHGTRDLLAALRDEVPDPAT